jgi:hypothetical protein
MWQHYSYLLIIFLATENLRRIEKSNTTLCLLATLLFPFAKQKSNVCSSLVYKLGIASVLCLISIPGDGVRNIGWDWSLMDGPWPVARK